MIGDMKWVNYVFAMVFWWLNEILFIAILHFTNIEISDDTQINDELYIPRIFFKQGTDL